MIRKARVPDNFDIRDRQGFYIQDFHPFLQMNKSRARSRNETQVIPAPGSMFPGSHHIKFCSFKEPGIGGIGFLHLITIKNILMTTRSLSFRKLFRFNRRHYGILDGPQERTENSWTVLRRDMGICLISIGWIPLIYAWSLHILRFSQFSVFMAFIDTSWCSCSTNIIKDDCPQSEV